MPRQSAKVDTGTIKFALKNFWADYVGWGRARRREYWWAWLFYTIIIPFAVSFVLSFCASFFAALLGNETNVMTLLFKFMDSFISFGWAIATMVGWFCLGARRLHDTNRSAWNYLWGLLPIIGWIILFVYTVLPGDAKANKYGNPRF